MKKFLFLLLISVLSLLHGSAHAESCTSCKKLPEEMKCASLSMACSGGSAELNLSLEKIKLPGDFIQRLTDSCINTESLHMDLPAIEKIKIAVYPDPVSNQLLLSVNAHPDKTSLKIYDASGKVIFFRKEFSANRFLLDCKKFSPGMYFYMVSYDHQQLLSGKFIRQ